MSQSVANQTDTSGSNSTSKDQVYVVWNETSTIKYSLPTVTPNSSLKDLKTELFMEWRIANEDQNLYKNGKELLKDDTCKVLDVFDPTKDQYISLKATGPHIPHDDDDDFEKEDMSGIVSNSSFNRTTHRFYGSFLDDDSYESRPATGFVGLKNQGATCYLNSLIQVLYMTPEFRKMVYHYPCNYKDLVAIEQEELRRKDIMFQLQVLFAKLQYAQVSSISTRALTTSFGWENEQVFIQHDLQELNRVLCEKIEDFMTFKMRKDDYSVQKLYGGKLLNYIKCTNCNRISTRAEEFYDIQLSVKKMDSIQESLEEFTKTEVLDGENAYKCDKCNSKQKALKSLKIKSLPKILNFQLIRFEYDFERDIRVKINDDIKFPMRLEITPYMLDEQLVKEIVESDEKNPDLVEERKQELDQLHKRKQEQRAKKREEQGLPPEDPSEYAKIIEQEDKEDKLQVPKEKIIYELVGICIHSGNAAFGHYYAFIREQSTKDWYKFNDENVTRVRVEDIEKQFWSFSTTSAWGPTRTTTPYMLVYRRVDQQESSIAVPDEEIPKPILDFLEKEQKEKEEAKRKLREELDTLSITIFRNRIELPKKKVRINKHKTLSECLDEVKKLVADEADKGQEWFYRFRRVATRKNNTKRPMNAYKTEQLTKTLNELGIDKENKTVLYLEQDLDPTFSGLPEEFETNKAFLSIRVFNRELRRPTSLRDIYVPKSTTLKELKEYLSPMVGLPPEKMAVIEEETHKAVHLMAQDGNDLSKYQIISGDILHIEPIDDPEHPPLKDNDTVIKHYFNQKLNEVILTVTENIASYKRRTEAAKQKILMEENNKDENNNNNNEEKKEKQEKLPEDKKLEKIVLKVATNTDHLVQHLKNVLSFQLDVSSPYIRLYAKDYYNESGKIIKGGDIKIEKAITARPNRKTTDLLLEILENPEIMKKGDKLFKTFVFDDNGSYRGMYEIQINKNDETILDWKKKIQAKVDVPPERLVMAEWFNDSFLKLFPYENQTVAQSRIGKLDIIRMVIISDPELNVTDPETHKPNKNMWFQLVKYASWEESSFGRKEMKTTIPVLITFKPEHTLFDLRKEIARRVGADFWNINIAHATSFPITEMNMHFIKEYTQLAYVGPDAIRQTPEPLPSDLSQDDENTDDDVPLPPEDDEDWIAMKKAVAENKSRKCWDFKAEKCVKLHSLPKVESNSVWSYENVCPEKESKNQTDVGTRGKKRIQKEEVLWIGEKPKPANQKN